MDSVSISYAVPAALAAALGCNMLPAAPAGTFERAMKRYEAGQCRLFDPALYRELHETYGCFPRYLDVFCRAAEAVETNEALARYACYLEEALRDRENAPLLCKPFFYPVAPSGGPDLAWDMVTALPVAAMVPHAAARMAERGIAPDSPVGRASLLFADNGVHEYARRNGGRPAFRLFEWFQLSIDAKLFRVGRLEIELGRTFHARAKVFRDESGALTVLGHDTMVHRSGRRLGAPGCTDEEGAFEAVVTETEKAYIGHPADERGLILPDTVTLPKSRFAPAIEEGDPIVNLHIPPADSFTREELDRTMVLIREFMREHFPEIGYRAFFCDSWMLDPQLGDLLKPGSRIVDYQRRFRPLPAKGSGAGIYYFVFSRNRGTIPAPDDLQEDTSLQRVLKDWVCKGNYIFETPGFFLAAP